MKTLSRKQKAVAEINITPFTDVILVLLIIFMVTTPLMMQKSIKVNLPNAKSARAADPSNQINIMLTGKHLIYMDGDIVSKEELKEKIFAVYSKNPSIGVMLVSDRSTQFKDIVAVLDIMNALGIRNLNIAAKAESKER